MMRDVLEGVTAWYRSGVRFAVATVVQTWSSSPRGVGASMAVSESGDVIGSVSGGCVEGAVYEVAQEVLQTGIPQSVSYGVSDDDAFTVGLTCGGTLELFVHAVDSDQFPDLEMVISAARARLPVAICTLVGGSLPLGSRIVLTPSEVAGSFGAAQLDRTVVESARGMLEHGTTGMLRLGQCGERRLDELSVFVESYAPPPRMVVFGAIDFAAAMARIGKFLGYHVTICDARPVFATRRRFPEADDIVVKWPHQYLTDIDIDERTVLCVLTHDPKFDLPLLEVALRTKAGYIGAMGSRRTHNDRLARLRQAGVPQHE
ncbi:XdhC family protein, partial [Streptomyces spiralis]